MTSMAVVDPVAGLAASIDAVSALSLAGVSGAELMAVLDGLEVQRRRLQALDAVWWPRSTRVVLLVSGGAPRRLIWSPNGAE